MNKDELISRQQIEIWDLRKKVSGFEMAAIEVYGIIFGIGGPLNDNKLGYTKEQKHDFRKIAEAMDYD